MHVWLHIPDIIEQSGPLWAYWAWVMERFCGHLSRAVSSRKWPYSSLNRRILEVTTLHSIRHMYELEDRLPPYTAMYNTDPQAKYHDPNLYPDLTLLHPRSVLLLTRPEHQSLRRRIVKFLMTQYGTTSVVAEASLPQGVIQWGRVQIDNNDIVNANLGYGVKVENRQDATFMQYKLVVDALAHRPQAPPNFQPTTFFGQLERVFVCEIGPSAALGIDRVHPLILMDMHLCNAQQDRWGFWEYEQFRYHEVIDGTSAQALVGQIKDRGKWVFVQRAGVIEHATFLD